jgi:OOP family OmpA-OmpF porin
MRRLLLSGCFTTLIFPLVAQQLQWASKVIGVSSELTEIQYSADQILGKPNVMPAGGQSPNAWTPDKPKRKEWIKVGYDHPIEIQQVAIAESYNPSGLYRLLLYDEAGTEYPIRTFNPTAIPLQGRMLNIMLERTPYKVAAVKLEFDGAALPEYFSIDAVAITDAHYPVIANIDKPELLKSGLLVEKLDASVNSNQSEMNPMLSPDGTILYFGRQNHPGNKGGVRDSEDVWYSELGADGKWTLAKNMGPEFNDSGPNFINSITAATPDGKSVVMLLGNKLNAKGKVVGGVSISDNINGKWSKPRGLEIENDYNFSEKSNYFLANSRKALIMSVEREDTRGGRDLYVSFVESDSTWTEPVSLGGVVNTAGDESAPFLAGDDVTLYFSSTGFSGYGKSDIYVSKRLDATWKNWSEPKNMGPQINSKGEDLFFNIPVESEYAYYSRGESEDKLDIFRVALPLYSTPQYYVVVKGKLVDEKSGTPVSARIIYELAADGKEIGNIQSNPETGNYEIRLEAGKVYGVRAEADGHVSLTQTLDLRDFTTDTVVEDKNIALAPVEVAVPEPPLVNIILNDVFFDIAKSVVTVGSSPELNRVVDILTQQPGMQVLVAGHTDSTGPAEFNLQLSKERATRVAEYLFKKGVARERITISYFGETKPMVDNSTAANRKKNRRVEFIILKMQP